MWQAKSSHKMHFNLNIIITVCILKNVIRDEKTKKQKNNDNNMGNIYFSQMKKQLIISLMLICPPLPSHIIRYSAKNMSWRHDCSSITNSTQRGEERPCLLTILIRYLINTQYCVLSCLVECIVLLLLNGRCLLGVQNAKLKKQCGSKICYLTDGHCDGRVTLFTSILL